MLGIIVIFLSGDSSSNELNGSQEETPSQTVSLSELGNSGSCTSISYVVFHTVIDHCVIISHLPIGTKLKSRPVIYIIPRVHNILLLCTLVY